VKLQDNNKFGNVSYPLSSEALGHAVGEKITLDTFCCREDGVRMGWMPNLFNLSRKQINSTVRMLNEKIF